LDTRTGKTGNAPPSGEQAVDAPRLVHALPAADDGVQRVDWISGADGDDSVTGEQREREQVRRPGAW
jgi:hypothetical protein